MADQRNTVPAPLTKPRATQHQHRAVKGRVREQYWPGTLMGFGIFIGLASASTVAPWTEIAPGLLFRVFLVLCFAGNLLPYLRSGLWLGMERLEWFLFNLLAVGPIGTSLLLWMNFLVHGEPYTTEHDVGRVEAGRTLVVYHFKDHYLEEHVNARSTYQDWYDIVGHRVRITEANGLFGWTVVLRKEPLGSGL